MQGTCQKPVTNEKFKVDFVIVNEAFTPLLSGNAAQAMGLITVNYGNFKVVNGISTASHSYIQQFPTVFKDTPGILPGKRVHLTVEDGATPVVRCARTLSEARKDAVKAKLQRLVDESIIVPIDEPTDWSGYLHCELDHESSLLTTFATPFGRFRWLSLPFGLKVSSEIFQKRLHQALEGLEGVRCIADDVIVWGRSNEEHDARVSLFLQRCSEIGISLNKEKCRFGLREIPFMGHVVSNKGLKNDPSKVEAILKMEPPTDKAGVERLRGTVNYLSRFVPKLTDVMRPISDLTRPDNEWSWTSSHDKAFEEVKHLLTVAPVLAYFDPSKELSIQCNASAQGLGAALLQEGRPLAYASRALSDTETRYATIEKEMLAIVFALEKWHQYTFGRPLTLLKQTIQEGWPDHQSALPPLVVPYFSIRDELAVTDGLVFRGERLVIPKSLKNCGHQGIESCLRRAREHVFWPGMNKEVKEWIQTCEACREFEKTPCKETLIRHEIPDSPWQKIATDLFTFKNKEYLVTVCYRSNFWEVDRLYNTKSSTVIKKLKAHLARHGIPKQLVTDNGPQFVSDEFRKFTESWGIEHTITSPHHSQANGKCEAAVKVAKRMLRKTTKSGEDQYLALLNIRNVPTQGIDSSPAQRLFGRRTRTLLPTTQSQPRNPVNPESVHLRSNQERQAKYYNRTAHDLPILKPGDTVRMKPFALGQKSWDKAHVTKRLVERTYEVQSAGTTFRCNRQHLVKTTQPTQFEQSVRDKATPNEIHDQQTSSNTRTSVVQTRPERTRLRPSPHRSLAGQKNGIPPLASHPQREKSPPHSLMQTRSGRIIKAPAKFKDHIMS
nr:uncharacterized protein K02A2.6-like [Pocillopora verrucosa]